MAKATPICSKCGGEKIRGKNASAKLGYQWRCLPCGRSRSQEYYQQNTDRMKELGRQHRQDNIESYQNYQRDYRQRNADRLKEQMRNYYRENRESIRNQQRDAYQQNAEQRKQQAREWASANKDRRNEISRNWVENNPERRREIQKQWRINNLEYGRVKCAERRARKRAVESSLTTAEWIEIQKRFDYRCAYCLKPKKLSMDHVVPISKGGSHTADNVVPACLRCNSRKHAGPPPVPVQTMLFA